MKAKTETKKMNFRKCLLAMVAAVVMVGTTIAAAVPTQAAANVPPTDKLSTTFDKYLVMEKNANVPNVTFEFTIAPGTAVDAAGGAPAIYEGIGIPTVDNAVFTPQDTTTPGIPADPEVSDKKYATKEVTVDFSKVSFTAPGIYRYIVTETANNDSGIDNDTGTTRTLDVYVKYAEGSEINLEVTDYILHEGSGNPDTATKSTGFTNTYTTNDLKLTKDVRGNQGNRDKYFAFTVAITGAVPGTVYTVDLPDTESDTRNQSTITVEADGNVTETYYLKDDQSIVIQGLTAATKYQITETDYSTDGYTTTYKLDSGSAVPGTTFEARAMGGTNHTVLFTNTKNGSIPTGILLETAPYLILGVVVIAGAIALFVTRRRRAN